MNSLCVLKHHTVALAMFLGGLSLAADPLHAQSNTQLPAETPREAVLAIAFASHDSIIRNRLPRVVEDLHGWLPIDSLPAGIRRGITAELDGFVLERAGGDTLLRMRESRNAPAAYLLLKKERRESDFAVVRAELHFQEDTLNIITVRLVAEDGLWKVMGLSFARRPADYSYDPERWEVEDLRLTDPLWWEVERAFARGDRQWEAKERLRDLREALATYNERYGQFPTHLGQLGPPTRGARPTAERSGLLTMECTSDLCTRDGLQYRYISSIDEEGRAVHYAAAVFQQFPGEEPYLLGHLDPSFGVMDPEETLFERVAQTDPLVRASAMTRPERATQEELAMVQAQVESAFDSEFMSSMYQGDFLRAAAAAEAYKREGYRRFGMDHPLLANTLISLASAYALSGQPQRFESIMAEAGAVASQPEWGIPAQLAELEANLGWFYVQLGNLSAARPLLERAAERLEDLATGRELDELEQLMTPVTAYLGLARLYVHSGRIAPADRVLSRLLWRMPEGHVFRSAILLELADIRLRQNRPLAADSLLTEIEAMGVDEAPIARATILGLQAEAARQRGLLSEAVELRVQALAIYEALFGDDHVNLFEPLLRLSELYFEAGMDSEFEMLLGRLDPLLQRQLQLNFSFMSEGERLAFTGQMESYDDLAFSYFLRSAPHRPASAAKFYDLVLRRKGLVAVTLRDLRRDIETSGDSVAIALLQELTAARARLAAQRLQGGMGASRPEYVLADASQSDEGEVLLFRRINELEKQLLARREIGPGGSFAGARWQEVGQTLRPGEAAVEYVHFRFRKDTHAPPEEHYVALVLSAERPEGPLVVDLGPADAIELEPLEAYGRAALTRGFEFAEGVRLMGEVVWDPIMRRLGRVQRVYVAPDGVLNQVNLALVADRSGRLLMETIDLRLVTSTRRLTEARMTEPGAGGGSEVILVGDPDFRLAGTAGAREAGTAELDPGTGRRSRDTGSGNLQPLPHTSIEIKNIYDLLQGRWNPSMWLDTAATEERVKAVRSPRVLHLATHGFFLPDQRVRVPGEGVEEPLLRSGVYLSGAARTLAGEVLEGEDGVLTALEASSLQLDGTEMVVLSACDTGLGSTVSGEGVLGLQRALQRAGAESVLMSLWSVPDAETAELMILFYERWNEGADAAVALRGAQLEMRERVRRRYGEDLPYYWGAFVLLQ